MASESFCPACVRASVVRRSVDASDRSTPSCGRGESAKAKAKGGKKKIKKKVRAERVRVERKKGKKSGDKSPPKDGMWVKEDLSRLGLGCGFFEWLQFEAFVYWGSQGKSQKN